MTDAALLDAAVRAGDHVAATALWSEGRCTWEIVTTDPGDLDGMTPLRTAAGGGLYQGTAGIALFLAELERIAPDAARRRALDGALAHAGDAADALSSNAWGYHSGRVGIAWAFARAAEITGRDAYAHMAREVISPLVGHEAEDGGRDVVGGAAGAVVPLLRLAEVLDDRRLKDSALALADGICEAATHHGRGWSWGAWPDSVTRHLCGYAHGASGYGHALLEAWNASGVARYAYGAEQAFAYERQFFDDVRMNWPDFRDSEAYRLLRRLRARVDAQASAADIARTRLRQVDFMAAWCHGAPGIGLARLRAWQLLKRDLYRVEARNAIAGTVLAVDKMENLSLCHGIAGNAETLLVGASVLADDTLRDMAVAWLLKGLDRYGVDPRRWPSGTFAAAADPSLLIGAAGVGHCCLRALDDDVPSVLCPIASEAGRSLQVTEQQRCAQDIWRLHFPATAQAVRDATVEVARADGLAPHLADLVAAYRTEGETSLVEEGSATHLELARFQLANTVECLAAEWLNTLSSASPEPIERGDAQFVLAPTTRLYPSASEPKSREGDHDATPPTPGRYVVLYVQQGRVQQRVVGAATGRLLALLAQPRSRDTLVHAFECDGDSSESAVRAFVSKQLAAAWTANIIEPAG